MAVIKGTIKSERIDGTDAADRIFGWDGADLIYGGFGQDELFGGRGSDRLFGGAGRDVLDGGVGVDRLYGGDGDDVLIGSGDAYGDLLWGGAGDDVVSVGAGDYADGGAGHDTLTIKDVSVRGALLNVDFGRVAGGVAVETGVAGIRAFGFERVVINLDDAAPGSIVRGGAGDDIIEVDTWSAKGVRVYGAGGNDTIYSSEGADRLDGGAGDDIIWATDGGDSAFGGDGDDTIYGSDGFETLNGGAGDDIIWSSGGGDLVTGGGGEDIFIFDARSRSGKAFIVQDFSADDYLFLERGYEPWRIEGRVDDPYEFFDFDDLVVSGAAPVAQSQKAQFLYDTSNGNVWLDFDGTGRKAAVLVAVLQGAPEFSAENILFGF